MKKMMILFILICNIQADTLEERRAKFLTDKHLSNLTIDFGVISCWERDNSKYVVIDNAGTIYAVNGSAKGHIPKTNWKDADSILKANGDYIIFSEIIDIAFKNGCTPYIGR